MSEFRGWPDRSGSAAATRVLIAGGGFAALESALALRALAGPRVELMLISPSACLVYRPAATMEAFGDGAPRIYDLRKISSDLGISYRPVALEAVVPREQTVRVGPGVMIDYDVLVLATGARAICAVAGALTFRDQRDVPRFRRVLDQVAAGKVRRLVFAIPSSRCWPLPAYELALLSSLHAANRAVDAEILLVTPEPRPLASFGDQAARTVAELLAKRRIQLLTDSLPHSVTPDGALSLHFDAPVRADRVVAVPELQVPRIAGIPANWFGFVSVDACGRVEGLSNVYAAGDMTTFPIKQGGLAAQQADVVAHTIASDLGAQVKEMRDARVLRARLLTGEGAVVLRAELDGLGQPLGMATQHHEARHADGLKVFGRYLTPYLSMYGSRLRADAAAA